MHFYFILFLSPFPRLANLTGHDEEKVGMENFELLKVLGTGGEWKPCFFYKAFSKHSSPSLSLSASSLCLMTETAFFVVVFLQKNKTTLRILKLQLFSPLIQGEGEKSRAWKESCKSES